MANALAGRIALAAALWLSLTAQSYGPDDLDADFERATIVLSTSANACHRIDVWLATNDAQRRRGLMFVRDLPLNHGMLFDFDDVAYHSIWMKNTFIPLDILYIRNDGVVSSIWRDAEPQSLRSMRSTEPVTYVLELNAGEAERLGVAPGDLLLR